MTPDAQDQLEWLAAHAMTWWQSLRPLVWDEAKHLAHPTVNTTTAAEKQLAEAVARWVAR